MGSVTVCTHLRFDPSCLGISTIFSYSIQSYINEFQLRASLIQGRPVQLALLVHGTHGPYHEAFHHDGSWHSVCVSWSQNGGHWALFTDGLVVSRGDNLRSSASIGADGLFIIGQEQDTFGGSFKKDESFSGSITELHIWERVLDSSEIHTMEKECSPISSGLVFKWSEATMEIESSVLRLWRDSLCQGNISVLINPFLHSFLDEDTLQNQNFSLELVHNPQDNHCVTFDPISKSWGPDKCDSIRGAICQFKKEGLGVSSFPKTQIFSRLSKDPLAKTVIEEKSVNMSWDRDLASLQHLTQAVLQMMEAGDLDLITSSDVLYLSQMMEMDPTSLATNLIARTDAAEVMVSVTTDYLRLASLMLEPHMVAQWTGLTEDGVSVGPFTVVKSIDSLTEALADMLSAEQRGFTISTKNIDMYMEWQKLSNRSSSRVFKPSALGSHAASSSGQDELLIPDTELQRIHASGYEEVVFIHTHYSQLNEIMSGAAQEPPLNHQEKAKRREQAGSWSMDGCRVTFAGSDVTSCLCNHTTNFAVLMNYLESKWSPEEELILTKLTFIGSGASLCALVVTLMLFTVLE
ncbi:hypothetical protein LDENG_00007710 [Lucifuga dentata]|nr:hypothetical protein LDENG_00007710 [Lucifuga dentata]